MSHKDAHRGGRRTDCLGAQHGQRSEAPHALPPKPALLFQPPMLGQALERMIREDYAPPCVVINERGDVEMIEALLENLPTANTSR